jgi:nitrate reductase gamma subunit
VLAVYVIPILLGVLIGLVLALVTWGLWRSQNQRADNLLIGTRGDVLVWLLILAALTLGIFITYILMGFQI